MTAFSALLAPSLTSSAVLASQSFSGLNLTDPALTAHDPLVLDRLHRLEAGDPNVLSIRGMDGGGGSGLNPRLALAKIYPNGQAPQYGVDVVQAVSDHGLQSALTQGTVFVSIQKVPGSAMPRLDTVSMLPVPAHEVYQAMLTLDDWSEWMPRNIFSRGTPTGRPHEMYHEAKVDGGAGGTFHYRSKLSHDDIDGGHQIRWSITPDARISPDRRHKGLRINDGSWTFVPVPGEPNQTIMAYQIHIEADGNRLLLKMLQPIITKITLGEFDQVVSAMANRGTDSGWTQQRGDNPSGMNYSIQKI